MSHNPLSAMTNGAYAYDAAGCLTNIVLVGSGHTNTIAMMWNGQYQLVSVAVNGTNTESFTYDALGRRDSVASGSTTNFLVYDGVHVIAEVDDDGDLLKSYTWGPGVDNLLGMTVYSGSSTNAYYALTDHLGTVHALADDDGDIVESYRYDAWGRVLGVYDGDNQPLDESAIGNHFLRQGRWYSWDTGLYYFRARWYDPVTGRWLSKDPIGISGGLNQYVAFNNNPVMFIDPDGRIVMRLVDIAGRLMEGKLRKEITQGGTITEETLAWEAQLLFSRLQRDPPSQMNWFTRRLRRYQWDTTFRPGFSKDKVYDYDGCTYLGREVNYFGQGMWGAAAGQSWTEVEKTIRRWKRWGYWHRASEKDLFWARQGYDRYRALAHESQ